MKNAIKGLVRSSIDRAVRVVAGVRFGRYIFERVVNSVTAHTRSIRHQNVELTFVAPNTLNRFRIDTFSTKEPETLEWIDGIPQDSVVWDIGANIGLYTCYAAKARRCRVFAFEPSVFNLEALARNVYLNGLTSQVIIIPLPVSDSLSVNAFNMSSTDWGGALSSFGQVFGHDGQVLHKVFEYSTIGISMTDAMAVLKIPQPDYIKMDVDGIEHLILKGGDVVLQNVRSVLIEINDEFERQRLESASYLSQAGLVLKEKRHADMFENSQFKNTYNQIWTRRSSR
jgi:FkbM family methyltransferase